jgi:uncharacterized protein (TIGR00730 family)
MTQGSLPIAIAVFGGSEPAEGSSQYGEAFEVGRLLALSGFTVLNGGYGGVMEASARGAREAGGRTIGVTTRAFGFRPGANPFIDTELSEPDLYGRTRRLIEEASGFIVLRGRSGTLAELAFLWALRKADLLGPKPILLVGTVWEDLLAHLRRLGLLDPEASEACRLVPGPREAVESMERALRAGPPAG